MKPAVAREQLDARASMPQASDSAAGGDGGHAPAAPAEPGPARPTRFWGQVPLDPVRLKRDAGTVADEVVAHLAALLGARVRVELQIEAEVPDGVPDDVVRTVTENARAIRFSGHGFEADDGGSNP